MREEGRRRRKECLGRDVERQTHGRDERKLPNDGTNRAKGRIIDGARDGKVGRS